MNPFRNPYVVGGLVIIALGIVGYQIFQPHWPGSASAPQPVASAPLSTTANPQPATPAESQSNPPTVERGLGGGIDRSYVQQHLTEWIDAPQRDPFLVTPSTTAPKGTVSPIATWVLKAIWRQTGGRLAAINNGIYKEGDVIEGYTLERIEADQVWFQGPNTKERLTFPSHERPATNAPALK